MNRLLELANGRFGHASGALWLPAERTLFVADAHLGYGWAQRRRGELGPLADEKIRVQLLSTLDELAPQTLVFLGDLVHAPRPAAEEQRLIADILRAASTKARVIIVRGNHDRGFERDFSALEYSLVSEWRAPGLLAVHGDRLPPVADEHLVLGHFHPALSPRDAAGARQRIPAFVWTAGTTILPAFSPFAAGADLARHWTPALDAALGPGAVKVAVCTGKRVAQLPFRRP